MNYKELEKKATGLIEKYGSIYEIYSGEILTTQFMAVIDKLVIDNNPNTLTITKRYTLIAASKCNVVMGNTIKDKNGVFYAVDNITPLQPANDILLYTINCSN